MDIIKRTNAFIALGRRLEKMDKGILDEVAERASYKNPWFTYENVRLSLEGLIQYLDENKLKAWLHNYDFSEISPKSVGVVMAGNIPLVGVHDMICVLLSGHKLIAKLSNQDDVLIPFVAGQLIDIEPEFEEAIQFVDKLKGMDAVIATGSDNTARYFDYYFSHLPNIIRKNRTSVAVLTGDETPEELNDLSRDMFSYFGMGCRNVSKLFLPEGYDIKKLISHVDGFAHIVDHHKYHNNYFYYKSIFLVNCTEHLDSGFAIYQQNNQLTSPVSVIYYEHYNDIKSLKKHLNSMKDKIQCTVSKMDIAGERVKFGKAQMPEIWDYADNVDTMKFLSEI